MFRNEERNKCSVLVRHERMKGCDGHVEEDLLVHRVRGRRPGRHLSYPEEDVRQHAFLIS